MELTILEEIGLTQGETNVYLALLRLGSTKTGQLAAESGVSSSKVYKILDRLMKKGLAGYVIKRGTKFFKAMEPKRIIDYIEEKEKQLDQKKELVRKMLPQLELEQKRGDELSEATVYTGFKAVTNFFRNIIDELESGETYYVIGAGYGDRLPGLRPFFYNHHKRRMAKKIKLKMLANYNANLEKTTKMNAQVKYLPQTFMSNMEIVFYRNKTFIAIFTREPNGFLIESSETVKSFQGYFDMMWKIAKQ